MVWCGVLGWGGVVFRETHLGVERNPQAKFGRNSSTGYGGDEIMEKIKMPDGGHICRRT